MGPCWGALQGGEERSHDSIPSILSPAVPTQEGTPVCKLKDRGWWVSTQTRHDGNWKQPDVRYWAASTT